MNIFDTKIQQIKNKVLQGIIKKRYDNDLDNAMLDIPKDIVPGPKSDMRCCIYKERAVLQERIKMAMGGNKEKENILEVMPIACDECPIEKYFVTHACRGCITHRCQEACPVDAISIVNHQAIIDHNKCIECGRCAKACPYSAIIENVRPCVKSCDAKAIEIDPKTKQAVINDEKCVNCGACMMQCPFGAIADKSYVLDMIDLLEKSKNNTEYNVYAMLAPSIVSQFSYTNYENIISGIIKLGFKKVYEVAEGADITLQNEIEELKEKEFITSSCCPSFVRYIELNFPELKDFISKSKSPMIETAKLIKDKDKSAKVVFIGPCTSKKYEFKRKENQGIVDCVITFEELQAFFDAKEIKLQENLPQQIDFDSSYHGRIFAKSGGIAKGINELSDKKAINANGLQEAKVNLLKKKANKLNANFLEGMACSGGCCGGAGCLVKNNKSIKEIEDYALKSKKKLSD